MGNIQEARQIIKSQITSKPLLIEIAYVCEHNFLSYSAQLYEQCNCFYKAA